MESAGYNSFKMEAEILIFIQTKISFLNTSSEVQMSNDRHWQLQ